MLDRSGRYQLIAYFEGEAISPDGGLMLPPALGRRIGITVAMADRLPGHERCHDLRERAGKNGY